MARIAMNHKQKGRLHLHVEALEKWDLTVYSEDDEARSGESEQWVWLWWGEPACYAEAEAEEADVKMGDG